MDHKDSMDLVLSLDNSYTRFLVHSRDVLLKTMKVLGAQEAAVYMQGACTQHMLPRCAKARLQLAVYIIQCVYEAPWAAKHAFMWFHGRPGSAAVGFDHFHHVPA